PSMAPGSLAVLENRRVIAVDQDRLGHQAERVGRGHHVELWVRRLRHGAVAVLVLNRSGGARSATVKLTDVPGLRDAAIYEVRELWTGATGTPGRHGSLTASVASHGVAMWRVRPRATSSAP